MVVPWGEGLGGSMQWGGGAPCSKGEEQGVPQWGDMQWGVAGGVHAVKGRAGTGVRAVGGRDGGGLCSEGEGLGSSMQWGRGWGLQLLTPTFLLQLHQVHPTVGHLELSQLPAPPCLAPPGPPHPHLPQCVPNPISTLLAPPFPSSPAPVSAPLLPPQPQLLHPFLAPDSPTLPSPPKTPVSAPQALPSRSSSPQTPHFPTTCHLSSPRAPISTPPGPSSFFQQCPHSSSPPNPYLLPPKTTHLSPDISKPPKPLSQPPRLLPKTTQPAPEPLKPLQLPPTPPATSEPPSDTSKPPRFFPLDRPLDTPKPLELAHSQPSQVPPNPYLHSSRALGSP